MDYGPPPPPPPLLLNENAPAPVVEFFVEEVLDCAVAERFERLVVMTMARDGRLLSQFLHVASGDPRKGIFPEMSNPLNGIATAVAVLLHVQYYPGSELHFEGTAPMPRPSALVPLIREAWQVNSLQTNVSLDAAIKHVFALFSYPEGELVKYRPGILHNIEEWVLRRQVDILESRHGGLLFLEAGENSYTAQRARIEARIRGTFSVGEATDLTDRIDILDTFLFEEEKDRLRTGFPTWDNLGHGGVALGDTWLILAARGSGKSILSGQVALNHICMNIPGVFISTEMDAPQMATRWLANALHVPMDEVRHRLRCTLEDQQANKWIAGGNYKLARPFRGRQLSALTDTHLSAYHETAQKLKKNLYFVDWREASGEQAIGMLRQVMEEKARREFDAVGGPKWMVFDWPAKLLLGSESDLRRDQLRRFVSNVVTMSGRLGISSMIVGQINMSEAYGKKMLTEANAADSKQLGTEVQGVGCISCLQNKDSAEGDGEGQERHSTRASQQFLYISKHRNGMEGLVPLRENFKYAKFECES